MDPCSKGYGAQYLVALFSPFLVSPFFDSAIAKGLVHWFFGMPSAVRIASAFAPGCDRTYFTIMSLVVRRRSGLCRFSPVGGVIPSILRGRPGPLFGKGSSAGRDGCPDPPRRSSRDTLRRASTTPAANSAARAWMVSVRVGMRRREHYQTTARSYQWGIQAPTITAWVQSSTRKPPTCRVHNPAYTPPRASSSA
jgi:hypothetical protein